MRKFWHYLGNIAGIIVALILYSRLEIFYFAPQRIHLGNLRVIVTALVTVAILFVIFYLYRSQLRERNYWGSLHRFAKKQFLEGCFSISSLLNLRV